ncbi:MAG: cupin domain-containing protein [Dehalococcoidia bacterium]
MGATVTRAAGGCDERAVLDALARERLRPSRWSNGAHDTYAQHSHGYHKVLYCLAGSIVFQLAESGEELELRPGDRLEIAPGTSHAAVVGPEGVACVEAPRA